MWKNAFKASSTDKSEYAIKWQSNLGHNRPDWINKVFLLVDEINQIEVKDIKTHLCVPCIVWQTKRKPITTPKHIINTPLELTHMEISGRLSVFSTNAWQYFAAFSATAWSAVHFVSHKSELTTALQKYKAPIENELNYRMKRGRLDRADEHISTILKDFMNQHGTNLKYSPPYASQSNSSSERLMQELWKVTRALLLESRLHLNLCAEAIPHGNWLMKVPYTLLYNVKPDMFIILRFSQTGYAF